MDTKHIVLTVPKPYNPPDIFQLSEPRLVAQVLDFGANILISLNDSATTISNDEIYKTLKIQAERDYLKKIKELVDELTKSHQQNEDLTNEHSRTLATIRQEATLKLEKTQLLAQSKHDILQIQYDELLKTVDTIKYQIRKEEKEQRQDILVEKDKQIDSLKDQLKQHRESLAALQENFNDFRKDLQKTVATQVSNANNSSIKGRLGEKDLRRLIGQVFGNGANGEQFSCEESAKEAYSADIQLAWQGGKVLWESKNYNETVNSKEIKKFQRDLEINREFAVGVMVSLYSGIAGHAKNGNVDLETLPDGRSIIYISNLFSPESPEPNYTLASLRPFLEVFIQLWKNTMKNSVMAYDGAETKETTELREKNEKHALRERQLTLMLNKHLKHLNEMKNEYNVQENKLKEMIVRNKTHIRESENYTKQMLDVLLLTDLAEEQPHSTNPELKDSIHALNTLVFRFRDFEQEYDVNEKKIIQELLEVVEIVEDAKVSGKDLKEVLRARFQWTDRRLSELKTKILQPEVWEAKSKDVKHLKFRNSVFSQA